MINIELIVLINANNFTSNSFGQLFTHLLKKRLSTFFPYAATLAHSLFYLD